MRRPFLLPFFLCAVVSDAFRGNLKTEPYFRPETFVFSHATLDRSELAPGYYFLDPMTGPSGWGPQIYTNDGVLIWHGSRKHRSQNTHVCDYLGEKGKHICYSHRHGGRQLPARLYKDEKEIPREAYGWNVVLDQSYIPIEPNITHGYDDLPLDIHAFEMQSDGNTSTFLFQRPRTQDLRPYGGDKDGWVANSCIGEIDNRSRETLFHWCYLESGLELWETYTFFQPKNHHWWTPLFYTYPNDTSPRCWIHDRWDFLHFNAIEKNDRGDYFVSVRHLNQIIKIAGPGNADDVKPGTVIWRLGGKSSDFKFHGWPLPDSPPFSRQHDVRFLYREGDEEILSLFDNAWEGYLTPGKPYSEGQILAVNGRERTARLLHNYPHPHGKLSAGRGSTRQLSNGNVLVGWGENPEFTEFAKNGTILQHIAISQKHNPVERFSYRVLHSPWVGKPVKKPKLVVHLRPCNTEDSRLTLKLSLVAYVSWNGATEVSQWRFSLSRTRSGPYKSAGTFKKTDYETEVDLIKAYDVKSTSALPFVQVEALDKDGRVLSTRVARASFSTDWLCEHWIVAGFAAVSLIFCVVEVANYVASSCYRVRLRSYSRDRKLVIPQDEAI